MVEVHVILFQAVKHLHDNNLVHVDIKPDNIFISYEGVCKLGDFGLVIDLAKVRHCLPGCRAVSNMYDCRSRGHEFDLGPVPYFHGD